MLASLIGSRSGVCLSWPLVCMVTSGRYGDLWSVWSGLWCVGGRSVCGVSASRQDQEGTPAALQNLRQQLQGLVGLDALQNLGGQPLQVT